jgi:hypothetical protein
MRRQIAGWAARHPHVRSPMMIAKFIAHDSSFLLPEFYFHSILIFASHCRLRLRTKRIKLPNGNASDFQNHPLPMASSSSRF